MAFAGPNNIGAFVPTTNVWDVNEIYSTEVTSPQFKELLVRLYQNINNISLLLNIKDTGYYDTQEFVNSQCYYPNPNLTSQSTTTPTLRQVYRKVIRMNPTYATLPNAGTIAIPHGLTPNSSWTFKRIYGTASDTNGFNYLPLPYASTTLANNIELRVDSTNVYITTGSDRTNFNNVDIILEYIKN
jgi:hypothetical protein